MKALATGLITLLMIGSAVAADCGMAPAFRQLDNDGKSKVSVWQGIEDKPLFFSTGLHINTDGTKHSYSVSDFWGETVALNNLCNAMSDRCAGPEGESAKAKEKRLRERRLATQRARDTGWPQDLLSQTKIERKIIAFNGKSPCKEVDGFLVNATALSDPTISNTCDFKRYVDSLKVPALVLPGRLIKERPTGFQARNAKVGDLAVVMSSDGSVLTYAVVGDEGPAKELGEGTIALARLLAKRTKDPANYCEVRGKDKVCGGVNYKGKGWDVRLAHVLIFPGTRNLKQPYMTAKRINDDTPEIFRKWGGEDRLRACAKAYRQ